MITSLQRPARGALAAALVVAASAWPAPTARAQTDGDPPPTPRAVCAVGSNPETGRQGQVPAADVASGRSTKGYDCNLTQIGAHGTSGGLKVQRYVDPAGHECAYYDPTLIFPVNALAVDGPGVYVLDMADPTKPKLTTTLKTPAMLSPHESLLVNQKRGLLAAVLGNPFTNVGQVDIYDLTADCRAPVLRSSAPVGVLGHESGWTDDGLTFYANSLSTNVMTAIDVTDPSLPITIGTYPHSPHGLSLSSDGNRAYLASRSDNGLNGTPGLVVLDTSNIQARTGLFPTVSVVSKVTWPTVSVPQNTIPITVDGHPYLVEIDEFAGGPIPSNAPDAQVGAGRIIDIADDTKPVVVSNLRLEVNQRVNRPSQMADPGANSPVQGYAGHYCAVPRQTNPGIVACSFIASGLRVFDISNPLQPREVAYWNHPGTSSSFAMSMPAFVPERREIWFSDGNHGFVVLRANEFVSFDGTPSKIPTQVAAIDRAGTAGAGAAASAATGSGGGRAGLAATGGGWPTFGPLVAATLVLAGRARRRRRLPV